MLIVVHIPEPSLWLKYSACSYEKNGILSVGHGTESTPRLSEKGNIDYQISFNIFIISASIIYRTEFTSSEY